MAGGKTSTVTMSPAAAGTLLTVGALAGVAAGVALFAGIMRIISAVGPAELEFDSAPSAVLSVVVLVVVVISLVGSVLGGGALGYHIASRLLTKE